MVVRSHGVAWGIPAGQFTRVVGLMEGVRLESAAGSLVADEVLAVDETLGVVAVPRLIHRHFPVRCRGLALWRQRPVLVVEGTNLPGFVQSG